jgi:membrane-associated HD superfamily phosphohydrolase
MPDPSLKAKRPDLLLADVVEASSRALSAATPARIRNFVRERIEKVFMDGQLDECEINSRKLHEDSKRHLPPKN